MVEAGLEFFFNMIKWVFNTFLMQIKILNIPLLYYFLVISIMAIVINGILNASYIGSPPMRSIRSYKQRKNSRSGEEE